MSFISRTYFLLDLSGKISFTHYSVSYLHQDLFQVMIQMMQFLSPLSQTVGYLLVKPLQSLHSLEVSSALH